MEQPVEARARALSTDTRAPHVLKGSLALLFEGHFAKELTVNLNALSSRRATRQPALPPPPPRERPAAPARLPLDQSRFEHSQAVRRSAASDSSFESAGTTAHVNVPFVSQFSSRFGTPAQQRVACLRACREMLASAGLRDSGVGNVMWLGGRGVSHTSQAAARDYLDAQLDAGRPVVVGVDRPGGSNQNADGRTDHWIVVTGRGVDEQGRTYYTFHDPGRTTEANGSDQNPHNRLYVDEQTGGLYSLDATGERRSSLTAVRRAEPV